MSNHRQTSRVEGQRQRAEFFQPATGTSTGGTTTSDRSCLSNKKVSIVIVNWNGLHHLKTLLPSLSLLTYPALEIIIVDNASTDTSVQYIRVNHPLIRVIVNQQNEGFANGNNIGVRQATGEYVLLLNNDTRIVQHDLIEHLLRIFQQSKNIGIAQPKILRMNYPNTLDSVGAYYTRTGFLYHFGYLQHDSEQFNTSVPLYTAKGACILIKKSLIDQIGLFDSDYFAYFEETDFCHRTWLAGYEVWYEPGAKIEHHIGGTSNAMDNAYVQFHSFKNRIHSYIKNLSVWELIFLLPTHIALCICAAVLFFLKQKPLTGIAILKAIVWNIIKLPKTLQTRQHIQNKIRKKSDAEFLPALTKAPRITYYIALFGNRLDQYKEACP